MSEEQNWNPTPGDSEPTSFSPDPTDYGWWQGYLAWDPGDEDAVSSQGAQSTQPNPFQPASRPQAVPPQPPHHSVSTRVALAAGASLIAFSLAIGAVVGFAVRQDGGATQPQAQAPAPSNLALFPQQSPNVDGQASKVEQGVVNITAQVGYQGVAMGTGMVLSSNGEILTNNHVIDGATAISVQDLGNGRTYTATVVGTDPSNDIAVLQLQGASGLATVPLGNSSKVAVGDSVMAMGNALGQGGPSSIASGQVTDLNQSITATDQNGANPENLSGLIQTNVNLQPGDSGGPLVNSSGQVVGIDTAASSSFGGGYGFHHRQMYAGGGSGSGTEAYAIPINQALSIAKQLEASK